MTAILTGTDKPITHHVTNVQLVPDPTTKLQLYNQTSIFLDQPIIMQCCLIEYSSQSTYYFFFFLQEEKDRNKASVSSKFAPIANIQNKVNTKT